MSWPAPGYVRYLASLFVLIAVPWLFVVAANVAIDPHGLSGRAYFLGLPIVPVEYPDPKFSKLFAVERIAPRTIAVGTSRTDHAIDVTRLGLAGDASPTYNLGFDAADISDILAYLKHACSVAPVRRVVLGLDFFSFGNFGRQPATQSNLLATPENPHGWRAR